MPFKHSLNLIQSQILHLSAPHAYRIESKDYAVLIKHIPDRLSIFARYPLELFIKSNELCVELSRKEYKR